MSNAISITKLLEEVDVILDLSVSSKKRLFEAIGLNVESRYDIPRSETFNALFARERLGSTGIGHGIALPHGKLSTLKRYVGVFARLSNAIQFESSDGEPVSMIFALLTPEIKQQHQHLIYLSHLAKIFNNKNNRELLHSSSKKSQVIQILRDSNGESFDQDAL